MFFPTKFVVRFFMGDGETDTVTQMFTCVALETYLAIFLAALNLAQHCSTTTALRIRHLDSNSRRAAVFLALHWMRVAAAA